MPELVTDDDCACTKDPIPQCGCCYKFELEQKQHEGTSRVTLVLPSGGFSLIKVLETLLGVGDIPTDMRF